MPSAPARPRSFLGGGKKAIGPRVCRAWVTEAVWAGLFATERLWASSAAIGYISYEVLNTYAALAPAASGVSAFATNSVLGTLPFALHFGCTLRHLAWYLFGVARFGSGRVASDWRDNRWKAMPCQSVSQSGFYCVNSCGVQNISRVHGRPGVRPSRGRGRNTPH